MSLEIKRKMMGELKKFARAEMARDLGARHGRKLRLPWDPDDAAPAPQAQNEKPPFDLNALADLDGVFGGD